MTAAEDHAEQQELTEQQSIKLFSQRIIRERTGNFHPQRHSPDGTHTFPTIDSKVFSNRGNKLLQNAETVSRKRLYNDAVLKEDTIYYNGSEHSLLHRNKRLKFFPHEIDNIPTFATSTTNDNDDDDDEMDLHKLVNVREILTPIASLSDVINKPAVARTFQNKIIDKLSLKTVLMIEKEQAYINRYSKLLDVFLGDYPNPLYESNLNLKDYDHNLTLPEEEAENSSSNANTNTNITETNETTEEDPFFALPQISNKEGLNFLTRNIRNTPNTTTTTPINNEQMELTRQMTQIALQRNEECIRNLLKIRNFLDKSTRIRERILAWSKESAGIQDEGVTVPNVLRVVKRGLISATTNKTVTENEDEENNNDEPETGK